MSSPGSETHTAHDTPSTTPKTGGVEPHHVPHGYVHPKEYHHWWWYAGFAGSGLALLLVIVAFCQYDSASAPLCSRDAETPMTSPSGDWELDVAQVSCLGGAAHQRILMRKAGSDGGHTVVSFGGEAKVRARWVSDTEVDVSHSGGQLGTFQPTWKTVRIRDK